MSYHNWSAVCPSCSTQTGSSSQACPNCGKVAVLFQRAYQGVRGYGGWESRTFKCSNCQTEFDNMRCPNCDALVGGVTKGHTDASSVLKLLAFIALIVVAFLFLWGFKSCSAADNKQENHGSAASGLSAPRYDRQPFPAGNFSSEGDIRSIVQAFTDNWNKHDVADIRSLWCSSNAPDPMVLGKQIDRYGHIDTLVKDIGGSGREASAEVTINSSNAGGEVEPWWFVNEGGSWKPCNVSFIWNRLPAGQ
jgi:hypothetical protein